MKFRLVSLTQNRARFRADSPFGYQAAEKLADRLEQIRGIEGTAINPRTKSILLLFLNKASLQAAMRIISEEIPFLEAAPKTIPSGSGSISDLAFWPLTRYFLLGPLLPMPLRIGMFIHSAKDIFTDGMKKLFSGKLTVEVLDLSAIVFSLLLRDLKTAATLALLLGLGEQIESLTKRRAMVNLTKSLALNIDTVWIRKDKAEVEVPLSSITKDDIVIVKSGSAVPVDGIVVRGEAMVNQASMTGESLPVHRSTGSSVFAGSVVEEGEIFVKAVGVGENTRLNQIIHFIENSEKTKAKVESQASRLADKIVPFSFLLAGLVWLVTRDLRRVASVLMVDYSCALKIATPVSFFSSMKEAANRRILVKGGKYLEGLANIDTVVFDKTGTLTISSPKLKEVVSLDTDWNKDEILRLSACLEEHFPHPVAKAIVKGASEKGLMHEELHDEVQYIVGHGICSRLYGERVLIGSRHYLEEDESIDVQFAQKEIDRIANEGHTVLYLAVNGKLVGLLGIEDPLRPESNIVIEELRNLGLKHIVMITGDGPRTAANVAKRLGLQEYYCQVLPDGKANIVKSMEDAGHSVLMIGDGINDSPALSASTVGVTLSDSADLAREVASVVLLDSDLSHLPIVVQLGRETLKRIHQNFLVSVSLNSIFLITGLLGILPAALGAVLHNLTTVMVTLNATRLKLPNYGVVQNNESYLADPKEVF